MNTQTQETLSTMTPTKALNLLKKGNQRFLKNEPADRNNLLTQVKETSDGQFPFGIVLGCIDSRVPAETVFDLGIGDIFNIRIAGNIVNEDILGSMEFATKVIGSKHILVLGHTSCGAVQGAIDNVELGNLTGLVNQIKPAVGAAKKKAGADFTVDAAAEENVNLTIANILENSPIIKELYENGQVGISGGMYDVSTGEVAFFS